MNKTQTKMKKQKNKKTKKQKNKKKQKTKNKKTFFIAIHNPTLYIRKLKFFDLEKFRLYQHTNTITYNIHTTQPIENNGCTCTEKT